MATLIGTLLRFSSSKHREMHRKTVDLDKLARVIAASLRLTEPGRQATFKIADRLMANGDPELLEVVFENLIGNAREFTGKQCEAVIECATTARCGPKGSLARGRPSTSHLGRSKKDYGIRKIMGPVEA